MVSFMGISLCLGEIRNEKVENRHNFVVSNMISFVIFGTEKTLAMSNISATDILKTCSLQHN